MIAGITTTYLIYDKKDKNKTTLEFICFSALVAPVFSFSGLMAGWVIGTNTFERQNYDISKYQPNKRKDIILNIFMKKQINL